MAYIYTILAAVFICNFIMLLSRTSKTKKTAREMSEKREKIRKQHADLERRLNHEQEDAARRVDLQNKTLEMYEQCRQNAKQAEHDESPDNTLGQDDGGSSAL